MTRLPVVPVLFAVLVFAGLGAWLYATRDAHPAPAPAQVLFPTLVGSQAPATASATPPAVQSSSPRYTDSTYDFSFSYPEGFSPRAIDDSGTRTITLSDKSGAGLQIAVSAFDEPGPLTEARIKQDLPDLPMDDVQNVSVGRGVPALAFLSSGGPFGDSAEVWFVYKGALYQISAHRSQAALTQAIVNSLAF